MPTKHGLRRDTAMDIIRRHLQQRGDYEVTSAEVTRIMESPACNGLLQMACDAVIPFLWVPNAKAKREAGLTTPTVVNANTFNHEHGGVKNGWLAKVNSGIYREETLNDYL